MDALLDVARTADPRLVGPWASDLAACHVTRTAYFAAFARRGTPA